MHIDSNIKTVERAKSEISPVNIGFLNGKKMGFHKVELGQLEHNPVLISLKRIALDIAIEFCVKIKKISLEKIALDKNEQWININFVIETQDACQLAKMNLKFSEKLADDNEYLMSPIDFVPIFIAHNKSQRVIADYFLNKTVDQTNSLNCIKLCEKLMAICKKTFP